MAVTLFSHEISDLCLGKPPLRSLPATATVGEAIAALKRAAEPSLSAWSCDHTGVAGCRCVGKVCMVDILCFLCREENLRNLASALDSSVSCLLQKVPKLVKHLDSDASLLDAVDCILQGAQNLVIPTNPRQKLLQKSSFSPANHKGRQFCWITQEDVARFFLNSINLFTPIPFQSIESLNIIDDQISTVHYSEPALSALPALESALHKQTSVGVVDDEGVLVGEISPQTLSSCDETVAAALLTLSAGDLMAYIDYYPDPPEDLAQAVKSRLTEKKLEGMLELLEDDAISSISSSFSSSASSSDDEDFGIGKHGRTGSNTGRFVRGSDPIMCYPKSSLVAVLIQALAHRLSYVWVVDGKQRMVGMVTLAGMLKVFRDRIPPCSS